MANNLYTLVIDGNYFISRLRTGCGYTFNEKNIHRTFFQSLSSSFANIVKDHIDHINHIIIVRDKNSWRKNYNLVLPEWYEGKDKTGYKQNRVLDTEINWDVFNEIVDDFFAKLQTSYQVPYCCIDGAEGDDWLYLTSAILSKNNIRCMMWTSDGDMNQLVDDNVVQFKLTHAGKGKQKRVFICNEKMNKYYFGKKSNDILSMFESNVTDPSVQFAKACTENFTPNIPLYLLDEITKGQSKDNIPPIITWKSERKYKGEMRTVNSAPTIIQIKKALKLIEHTEFTIKVSDLYDDVFIKKYIISLLKVVDKDRDVEHTVKVFKSNRTLAHLDKRSIPEQLLRDMLDILKVEIKRSPELKMLTDSKNIAPTISNNSSYFKKFNL